jgi:hypothetical protein
MGTAKVQNHTLIPDLKTYFLSKKYTRKKFDPKTILWGDYENLVGKTVFGIVFFSAFFPKIIALRRNLLYFFDIKIQKP